MITGGNEALQMCFPVGNLMIGAPKIIVSVQTNKLDYKNKPWTLEPFLISIYSIGRSTFRKW